MTTTNKLSYGIIRVKRGFGGKPEDDECHFDRWYAHKHDAQLVYDWWCEKHPDFTVAIVKQEGVRFRGDALAKALA